MKRFTFRRFVASTAVAASAASLAVAGLAFVPSASAAPALQILPTTTSVIAAPNVVVEGASATVDLIATVGPLDLLVTPSGTVIFHALNAAGQTVLSSNPVVLSHCLLIISQCHAGLTGQVGALTPGVYKVTAYYSGDGLSKPSEGITTFTVVAPS